MPSSDVLLSLDQPALVFVLSALLWSLPRLDRKQPLLRAFAAAYALYGLGLGMQLLLWPPNEGLNIMLSGLLYSAAVVLFCQGLGQLGQAPQLWKPCLAVMATALALRAWFSFGQVDAALRIWTLHGATMLCLGLGAWRLRRLHRGTWLERCLLALLVLFVLSFGPRLLLTVERHQHQTYGLDGTTFWLVTQLSFHVFMIVFAVLLLMVWAHRAVRRLRLAGELDPLTQVPNRRGFQSMVARQLPHCTHYSLLALDLDHFKRVNDSRGHAVGDEVLRQLGQLLQIHLRPGDVPARFGGEEFMAFLPDTPLAAATGVAERLRLAIAAHRFTADAPVLHCTCSFGVAEFAVQVPMQAAYPQADTLLYQAKAEGRNRVCAAMGQAVPPPAPSPAPAAHPAG